ncbi:hypothetical protein GGR57DRAFT_466957 [Xylariaceae sp. FL1272]|nr:hypothetical protein GGR57DRAFT_466957 [Xylariaceae sp. FL1272]
MDGLPSYREATTRPHWLSLVTPTVPPADWPRCCLVDHRFYRHFAPRLWQDPLVTIRKLGLHPNDGLCWYHRFTSQLSSRVRLETRCMVKCLDFRNFAQHASGLYSTEASERAISESFKCLPQLFPQLTCFLLGGHPELDPNSLSAAGFSDTKSAETKGIALLDLSYCQQELRARLFSPAWFCDLVYLDVSYVPGSLKNAISQSLNPVSLPQLRILKARGREMDDATAMLLFEAFRLQLCSLDLSHNKLTDECLVPLLRHCFSPQNLPKEAHFESEGKLMLLASVGTRKYGIFGFIEESETSANFTHPERYLADAPLYSEQPLAELQEWQNVRPDGTSPLKRDDVSTGKALLLSQAQAKEVNSHRGLANILRTPRAGLTHLYLSGNAFTCAQIAKLVRMSYGRLEHFDCDMPQILPKEGPAHHMCVGGLLGVAHLFRPVWSSSLRSLRVHHSLVTQVPNVSVRNHGLSRALLELSESIFYERATLTYPQHFEIDMNPRLTSLALTKIPARSTGPVIHRLCSFIASASMQRRAVEITKEKMNERNRYPATLDGLRHLCLELEPDFEATEGSLIDDEFDYKNLKLSNLGNKRYPNDLFNSSSEYVVHTQDASESLLGDEGRRISVWVGPGTRGPYPAVNEYMRKLNDPELRKGIGPVTPSHVLAGAPPMSYIFHDAWDAMMLPDDLVATARRTVTKTPDATPLIDVADAIKQYRLRTKGTSEHWDGKIELVRADMSLQYQTSEYWR